MRYLEYREERPRGNAGFPFAYYHITPAHPRYYMPPHWHDEYELVRVLEGQLQLIVNREEFHLHEGDAFLVSGGFLHSGTPRQCHYECVVVDLDFYLKNHPSAPPELTEILNQQTQIRPFFSAADTGFQELFRTMTHALSSRQRGYSLITVGALYEFLGLVLKEDRFLAAPKTPMVHSKKFRELKTVLNFIALHYTEPVTLQDLADCVHMNPNYFCKFFRELTQKSPMEYLNFYRIECACEKLCLSNDSVLTIALESGFNDVNYFIKVFKKFKGTTPMQYLKTLS